MSITKFQTPLGIDPATFRFVAHYLNHCATACPVIIMTKYFIIFAIYYKLILYFSVHKSTFSQSHTDESARVLLHAGDDKRFKRLLYTAVHSLMLAQRGLKQEGFKELRKTLF
jgi:hypothetical protein